MKSHTPAPSHRLDDLLVARGLAPSRARARDAIKRGMVQVNGCVVVKAGQAVAADRDVRVNDPGLAYVSRGALKLLAGLERFGFDPGGRVALDLGASTGGFTQVLLERGARRVYAVDVGRGQMDARVKNDPRVVSLEGVNARDLARTHVPENIEAVTADVSFISLRLALPPALALAEAGAWGVFLVKPQFEVGRESVGKGGIVRDAAATRGAVEEIARFIEDMGWAVKGIEASPVSGGDGNEEFLIGALKFNPKE